MLRPDHRRNAAGTDGAQSRIATATAMAMAMAKTLFHALRVIAKGWKSADHTRSAWTSALACSFT